jgi:hypothetical protein
MANFFTINKRDRRLKGKSAQTGEKKAGRAGGTKKVKRTGG